MDRRPLPKVAGVFESDQRLESQSILTTIILSLVLKSAIGERDFESIQDDGGEGKGINVNNGDGKCIFPLEGLDGGYGCGMDVTGEKRWCWCCGDRRRGNGNRRCWRWVAVTGEKRWRWV
ncbi:hypothetical protein L2E82_29641 [Cichorium intybus]|uniref:Uncharacterized protein n=1 Tax=Cichorium intybus TaxID=13427 RepID=A0ACB9CYS4_CICIN|nr:hypothetical protein L2E82_29641 [Cichorium intybus]